MTLADLRSDVVMFANRVNDAAFLAGFPTFLKLAEERIAEAARAKCMVVRATMPVIQAYLPLPCDWLAFLDVRVQGCPSPLTLLSRLDDEPPPGAAPSAYRLVDAQMEILPHQDSDPASEPDPPVLEVAYYARPMALAADADTTPLLDAHPSIYIWTTMLFAAMWLKDDALLQQSNDLAASAIAMANEWHGTARFSGGRLNARARAFS